ncbi:hypothetical protein V5799_009600 [Amblyomma americanum]|uniref:Uncharacterized protein n=1 Tax=Amblyomma americanum TaxID=6943 RepID=A0AAQ4FAG6_AMBAM
MTAGTLARFLEDRGDEAQEEIQHEDEINTDNPGPKDHSAEVDKLRTTPSLILTTRQPMRRTAGTGKKKTSRAARPSTTWSLSTNFKSSITTTPSTTTAETTTLPTATPRKTTTARNTLSTTRTATALPSTTSTKTTTTHSMTTKAATTLATKTSTITTTTQSTTTKASTTLPTTTSTKTTATQSTPSKATTTLPTKTSTKTTTTKTTTKAATTPPTKTSTKTATTQSTTTKASTTLPTTTSTKTTDFPSRGPWLQQNLLCTVNHFMNQTVVAPDDGLCDFMIFDSFFKDDKYNLGVPYEDGFHHFLQFSRNHVKTQYGVGFGYHEYKETKHTPDALIAVSHLAENDFNSGYSCRIMPPMFLDKPVLPEDVLSTSSYTYSMAMVLSNLKKFASLKRPKSALFVTVPVYAKWYTFETDEYGFESECGVDYPPSLIGSVVEVTLARSACLILMSVTSERRCQSWLEQQTNTDYPDDDVPDRPLKSNTQQRTTPKGVTLKPKPTSALTTNASRNADTSPSTIVLATTSEPQTVTWPKADALTPKPTSALTVSSFSKTFADTTKNGATKTPVKTATKTTLETLMKASCTAMNISKNTATKTAAKIQTTTYTNTVAVTPQMNLTRPDKKNATKASTLTSMKTVAKTATIITPEIVEPTTKSRNQPTNGTDSTEANVTKEGSKSEEQRPTTLSVARTPAFTSSTVTRISPNANASSTTHSLNTVSESLAANISDSDKAHPKPTAPLITTLVSKTSTNTATRADTSITTNSSTNTFEQFSMKTITKLVTEPSMNTATKTSNATSYTAMKTSANTTKTTTNNNATLTSTKISKTKTSTKTTTKTSTKTTTSLGTNTSTETTASPFTKTSKKAITKTALMTSTKVFTNTPAVTSAKASTKSSKKTATKTSTNVSTFTQASMKTSSTTSAKTTTKTSMNTSMKTSVHVLMNITKKITQKASTKTFGKNSTKFTIIITKPTTKTSASTLVATTKPSTKSVSDATSNTFTQTSTKVATKPSSKTSTTTSTFTAKKTSANTATKISATTSLKTSTKTSTRLPAKTSTKTTTTESEPQLKQSLLCTVNHFVKPSMVPPDDGLCDITLYDSFFKNGTYNLGPPYDDSFQHFLEFAAQHVKTEYGAAFAYAYKETRHTPHGLIAVVHLAEKDFFSGYACRIMPPMFLHRPQIPAEFSNTSPYTYSMVCKKPEYNTTYLASNHTGVVSGCNECKKVLTYDNEQSYRYKFCTLKRNLTSVRYGLLAIGIDVDDTANECGQGSYARLRSLRWLADFLKHNFTSPNSFDTCQRGP